MNDLQADKKRRSERDPNYYGEWKPITIMGKTGEFSFTNGGNVFLFIDEKILDIRPSRGEV
jgi:hypothetical protein